MVTIDSYSEANRDQFVNLKDLHPSDSVDYSAAGQSFQCGGDFKITSCVFYMRKLGSPTGNAYAKLYAHTGTYGTSSLPTGAVLGTSDAFDLSTLNSAAWELKTFTFTGAEQYQMSSNYYVIIFENPSSGTIDGSNYTRMGCDASSPTHGGNIVRYANGAWGADNARDMCFYVYGDAVGALSIPVAMHHYGHHIGKIIRG